MSPSARMQETTISFDETNNLWHCIACASEFEFEDLNDPADITPPKFCPNCGRRAS